MNVKFMNPFIEAAVDVLQAECQISATKEAVTLQKSAMTTDDVTVLLSLVGQVQGVVLYGLSKATSLVLVSKVMGQSFEEFDNLAQSGIAELGNVITGKATVNLSKTGITANISPPTLILGKGVSISTLDFARVVVPLATSAGEMLVHLALRESPANIKDASFVPLAIPISNGG